MANYNRNTRCTGSAETTLEKISPSLIKEVLENQPEITIHDGQKSLRTGFIDLDYVLGGLRRGEVYILAGNKGVGKTSFAYNLVEHVAIVGKGTVAYFSPAERKTRVIRNIMELLSKDIMRELEESGGTYKECISYSDRANEKINELGSSDFYLDDTENISVKQIARIIDDSGSHPSSITPDLIIIDNLQGLKETEDYPHGYEVILDELKNLAEEKDCPVLILSELKNGTRNDTKRDNKCDTRNDFKYGTRSETRRDYIPEFLKKVDNIIYLFRGRYRHSITAEFYISQGRNCDTGMVILGYDPERRRFCNLGENEKDELRESRETLKKGIRKLTGRSGVDENL